jgi:hypothetical protein
MPPEPPFRRKTSDPCSTYTNDEEHLVVRGARKIMSGLPLAGTAVKPVIDIFFGIGALLMFGELLLAIKRALSINFSATRILTIIVYGFLFAVCLDWVTGFYFFENTVAPLVWQLLGVNPT